MNTYSGLPSHPMWVHLAIVLIPILAVISIALVVRPAWRARWGIPVTIANLVLTVYLSALVMDSGEWLARELKLGNRVERHEELAEMSRILVALMFVGTLSLVIIDRIRKPHSDDRSGPTWLKPLTVVAGVCTIIVAVLATIWLIRTGHEGARITWEPVLG